MNRYLPHLATVLCATLLAGQAPCMDRTSADSLVAQAQRAYAAGDHAGALTLFDSVNTVWTSGGLEYNIGNCQYKLGNMPKAILHYERALKLEPGAEDVKAGLELARQQIPDRLGLPAEGPLAKAWDRLRGGSDPDHWARMALWSCLLCAVVLALSVTLGKGMVRRLLLPAAGLLLVVTLASALLAAVRAREVRAHDEGIIMTAKVELRSEPRSSGTVLFVLHKGSKVRIQQSLEGWLEVRLPNGSIGWMPSEAMERI